jgi:hypothetical protein
MKIDTRITIARLNREAEQYERDAAICRKAAEELGATEKLLREIDTRIATPTAVIEPPKHKVIKKAKKRPSKYTVARTKRALYSSPQVVAAACRQVFANNPDKPIFRTKTLKNEVRKIEGVTVRSNRTLGQMLKKFQEFRRGEDKATWCCPSITPVPIHTEPQATLAAVGGA